MNPPIELDAKRSPYRWLVLLIAGFICMQIPLGIYALLQAPTPISDEHHLPPSGKLWMAIDDIVLTPDFFLSFPEFSSLTEERAWWQKHAAVYQKLQQQPQTQVRLTGANGMHQADAQFAVMRPALLAEGIVLVYLCALISLVSGLYVWRRHHTPTGASLTCMLFAVASYLASAVPVVYRPLTLPPMLFEWFVSSAYISETLQISLAHFALLFPRRNAWLQRYPAFTYVIYGFAVLIIVLYLLGGISFGASAPTFFFWVALELAAFTQSLRTEQDPLIRKQLQLALLAPLLIIGFFAMFHIPGLWLSLDAPPSRNFTYIALGGMSLSVIFALVLDNVVEYRKQLQIKALAEQTQRNLKADLHDIGLHGLALVGRIAQQALMASGRLDEKERQHLSQISDATRRTARELRGTFQVTDVALQNWQELSACLRESGHAALQGTDIHFTLSVDPPLHACPLPSLRIRQALYLNFLEALENVARHSGAARVDVHLGCADNRVLCRIQDDGHGFDASANAPKATALTPCASAPPFSVAIFLLVQPLPAGR